MKKSMLLFLTVVGCISCVSIHHKSKLTLKQIPFASKNIRFRTDGFYFAEHSYVSNNRAANTTNPSAPDSIVCIQPMIFYADGYVWKDDAFYQCQKFTDALSKKRVVEEAVTNFQKRLLEKSFHTEHSGKSAIADWGLYREAQDQLSIQYYFNHFGNYRMMEADFSVLTDTTLLMTHTYSPRFPAAPHIIDENAAVIYKFKPCTEKPDSANYIRDHADKFCKKCR